MPEEVCKNFFYQAINGAELLFDQPVNGWTILQGGDLVEGGGDGEKDTVDLGILVYEHQSVRDVVVALRE